MAETDKKESGGFFKKVGSIFYNPGDEETTVEANTAPAPIQQSGRGTQTQPTSPGGTALDIQQTSSAGIYDNKIADHLQDLLNKNNIQGVDYYELKNALKGLSGLSIGEREKYIAAFSTLAANSGGTLTKAVLLSTADFYIGLLNKEFSDFNAASGNQTQTQVTSKEKELDAKRAENEDLRKQIDVINAKIQENMNVMAELGGNISTERIKIEQAKNNFKVTVDSFINEIESDKKNIELYLN